jgi:hypothetical protein
MAGKMVFLPVAMLCIPNPEVMADVQQSRVTIDWRPKERSKSSLAG